MNALVSKARKLKFELALKIIDLNNVPLVSGTSFVKWHLPSSTAAEHRGRTEASPIKEHKVSWEYEKIISVRLIMDKENLLQERIIQFEVVQEYNNTGARAEKITLGHISLNLAEYVEIQDQDGEDGVMRRYLMQESKINSTLKIGMSMMQLDGERNFIAPPLKTASAFLFGGIAGIMDFEQAEDDTGNMTPLNRTREAGELQDVYRRALAASWGAHAWELVADQCIEDIFSGGDGWGSNRVQDNVPNPQQHTRPGAQQNGEEDFEELHRHGPQHRHSRIRSSSSTRSMSTITEKIMGATIGHGHAKNGERLGHIRSNSTNSIDSQRRRSSSESSESGRFSFKHAQELDELSIREDLRAWKLPGAKA